MSNYKNHKPETATLAFFICSLSIFLFKLIFNTEEVGTSYIVFGIIGFTIVIIYLLLCYSYRLSKKYILCLGICAVIYIVAFLIDFSFDMIAIVQYLNKVSLLFLVLGYYIGVKGIIMLIKGMVNMLKDR